MGKNEGKKYVEWKLVKYISMKKERRKKSNKEKKKYLHDKTRCLVVKESEG